METVMYSTVVEADREAVWTVLWGDETYNKWTKVFADGSQAKSDWKVGSRVEFLDGKGAGMFSEIAELIPNELMVFKHLGSIKDGKDVPFIDELEGWTESFEKYRLTEEGDGNTKLVVEIDTVESFKEFFNEKFPVALGTVKELSERPGS